MPRDHPITHRIQTKRGPARAASIIYRQVSDEPEFLIVSASSDSSRYVLPGGKIELGESPEQAAVRESWEEAGARVRVVRQMGSYEHFKRSGVVHTTLVYLTQCLHLIVSPESRHSRWVNRRELHCHQLGLCPHIQAILENAETRLATNLTA